MNDMLILNAIAADEADDNEDGHKKIFGNVRLVTKIEEIA